MNIIGKGLEILIVVLLFFGIISVADPSMY